MAEKMRFESNSASSEELSFTGGYQNGQRGDFSGVSFDRSSSFRESSESRGLSSGASTPRARTSSDVPSITDCLSLEPISITFGDQKYNRTADIKKVLGMGSATEDSGAIHSKPPSMDEVTRLRASVSETASEARARIRRLNESLFKLNGFCEATNPKKQHRSEMLMTERSGVSNVIKMGVQSHRNGSDLRTQRLEDRAKGVGLNKRVRSSVAELRADMHGNTLPRQPMVMEKERDSPMDGGEGSDVPEDKIRKVPAGGEGWDRKMKRKRSVGSVFPRSTDNDGDTKRMKHHKYSNEPGLQLYDAQGFSRGSFNGACGLNKGEGNSIPANSNLRFVSKNEPEKVALSRDSVNGMNKERLAAKANNKLNINNDNHVVGPSLVTKGKGSRAPRTGSVMAPNSFPSFSRATGVPDGREQSSSINKVNSFGGTNNRKRSMPAGSSEPMAQWGGQRPPKSARTRRANAVTPVSNHDEMLMSSEGGHLSDFSTRVNSAASNGSLLAKDVTNGNHLIKLKYENRSSPARFSETEESGACANHEGRLKEKGAGSVGVTERSQIQNCGPSVVPTKKNKMLNKEDMGDGFRKLGRTGRGASSSRVTMSPVMDKLENPASAKPVRSTKPVPEKNGSKSGRPPLKKMAERKISVRGQTTTVASPDLTSESDDDREELLEAAKYACKASCIKCSSSFWKKVEPVFAPIVEEDISYLKQQLKSAEELHHKSSIDMPCGGSNASSCDPGHRGDFQSQLFEESQKSSQDHIWLTRSTSANFADQIQNNGSVEIVKSGKQVTSLYQRVLSALIVEEGSEEFEEDLRGRNIYFQNGRDQLLDDSCLPNGNKDRSEVDYGSLLDFETGKQCYADGFFCNGNANAASFTGFQAQFCNDDSFQGLGFMNSDISILSENSGDNDGKHCNYQQSSLEERLMMELQSAGLFPETVPDLDDGDKGDDAINREIVELEKGLHQKNAKMKELLNKLTKGVEIGKVEKGAQEQVAMDKLAELAYIKLLATRGSCASKFGVPKVSKQAAHAFMKRTLGRLKKYENMGKSCFSESPFQDIILGRNHTEMSGNTSLGLKSNMHCGTPDSEHDTVVSGSFPTIVGSPQDDFAKTTVSNRGKKKELLLEDVGNKASFRAFGNTLPPRTKGKRTERERETTSSRNVVFKADRPSVKGERKAKSKAKQKTAHLSTSVPPITQKQETGSNKKGEEANSGGYNNPPNATATNKRATDVSDLQDLSLELGVDSGIDSHQDLNNLFNFDEDIDLDIPMDGLEIPMDDLSGLNMF